MYSKLMKSKDSNELVALYSSEYDCDKFSVGYIYELKDDKILILNVGVHGEFDGYMVMYVDDIFRIETKSRYINKVSKLQSFKMPEKFEVNLTDDLFMDLVKISKEYKRIVAVAYGEEFEEIRGFVTEIGNAITFLQVNEYGEEDGETSIALEMISKIVFDDVECRDVEKLYNSNFKDDVIR